MPNPSDHSSDSSLLSSGLGVATCIAGLWLVASFIAGGMLLALGPGPGWVAAAGSIAGLGVTGTLILGWLADRRRMAELARLERATGLDPQAPFGGVP